MSDFQSGVLLLILSVFIASAAQILLKISAGRPHSSRLKEYLNPYVILGYFMMLASTILTMLALRSVPLSWSPALESFSYLFVGIMGYFILKERYSRKKSVWVILDEIPLFKRVFNGR